MEAVCIKNQKTADRKEGRPQTIMEVCHKLDTQGKNTHCSCLSHAKQTSGTPMPSFKHAATEPRKKAASYVSCILCPSPTVAHAVPEVLVVHPNDEKPNNLLFGFTVFFIPPSLLLALALRPTGLI